MINVCFVFPMTLRKKNRKIYEINGLGGRLFSRHKNLQRSGQFVLLFHVWDDFSVEIFPKSLYVLHTQLFWKFFKNWIPNISHLNKMQPKQSYVLKCTFYYLHLACWFVYIEKHLNPTHNAVVGTSPIKHTCSNHGPTFLICVLGALLIFSEEAQTCTF